MVAEALEAGSSIIMELIKPPEGSERHWMRLAMPIVGVQGILLDR